MVNLHGLFMEGAGTGIKGIRILSAGAVHIRKCLIRGFQNASGGAIFVESTQVDPMNVFISGCTLTKNTMGVRVLSNTSVGIASVFLNGVIVDTNATDGVHAHHTRSRIFMTNSIVTGNANGLVSTTSGRITSFGNNVISNNVVDGAFTALAPLQ